MPMKLNIIRQALDRPIADIQPTFDKLDNLHLELLENKKKLKSGLPLMPIAKAVKVIENPKIEKFTPQNSSGKKSSIKPQKELPSELLQEDSPIPQKTSQQKISSQKTTPFPSQKTSPVQSKKTSPEESPKIIKTSSKAKQINIEEDDDLKDLYESEEDLNDDSPQESDDESQSQSENENSHEEEEEEEDEDDGISAEEKEEMEKQEYLARFRILKKGNPNYKEFPDYTEHTPVAALKKMYSETVKMIQLEENVDSYKTWLQVGFFLIEIGLCKAGLDFKGFAKVQMKKMNKYEKMLIELGEKSYSNFTNNWPVEIRLIGVLIADALIFYICKIAADYMGEDVANLVATMLGIEIPQKEKPIRMRGPSIKPDQIR